MFAKVSGGILALEVVCVCNKGELMSSESGFVGVLPVTVAPISHRPLGIPKVAHGLCPAGES